MSTTDTIAVQTPPAFLQPAPERVRVLLVEDDRAVRRYLEVILRRAGYDVVSAADGLEALKAALASPVDLIITDAMMPHLNGHELCRFLRRHPKLSSLPVVILSAIEQGASPDAGGDQPDAYLSKPVRPEELTNCLARLLVHSS